MVTGWAIDEPVLTEEARRLRVLLVRHGESDWNGEGRIQGHLGGGLSAAGHEQADRTAAYLAAAYPVPDTVATSDLPRVLETAAPYTDRLGVPARPDPRLREVDNGAWSGRLVSDVAASDAATIDRIRGGEDLPRGGGERMADLRDRVRDAVGHLARETAAQDSDSERLAVVFTHGGPIRVAALAALGLDTPALRTLRGASNCSVTELEYWVGGSGAVLAARLVAYNSAHHLAGAVTGAGAD